jgi:organic hydroperoxide reductase OsmC/OhrA
MAKYVARVLWTLKPGEDFQQGRYSRAHTLSFDGGAEVGASASPHVVGKWADPAGVDPEEMLVAALSNCHMLTFLHKARLAGLVVTRYQDEAQGVMGEIAVGRLALTRVTLRPAITYEGRVPNAKELKALHHAAHEECYIANSVTTEVVVEGR